MSDGDGIEMAARPMIVRSARREDLPSIVAMLADDFKGRTREDTTVPLNPRYLSAFAAIEADPGQMLVVADIDGVVVGTLQLSFIPNLSHLGALRGQIEGVRIAGGRRGGGLGRRMILWAVETCRARGCDAVQLTTTNERVDAQRFYAGLGFAASHIGMKLAL